MSNNVSRRCHLYLDMQLELPRVGAATSTSQVHLVAVCLPGVKADRKGIANEQFWTKSERGAPKGVRVLGLRISPHGCHVPPAHLPPDIFFNALHLSAHNHF